LARGRVRTGALHRTVERLSDDEGYGPVPRISRRVAQRGRCAAHTAPETVAGFVRTHSDLGKHAPELPLGSMFYRNSLAVPAASQNRGALPLVSAPRTGAGRSGLVRSCPTRSSCLPLTCTSTRLGASAARRIRRRGPPGPARRAFRARRSRADVRAGPAGRAARRRRRGARSGTGVLAAAAGTPGVRCPGGARRSGTPAFARDKLAEQARLQTATTSM
jgi:hypothetical protein